MEETKVENVEPKKKDNREFWRAVKFTLFSISAGIIQTLSYTLCFELIGLNHWIASAIGLVLSVIWNFTINRKYTFKSINNLKRAMLLVAAFYAVFGPIVIYLNYLGEGMANGYLLLAGTMIVNLILEYVFMRFVVYKNDCDTLVSKKDKIKEEKLLENQKVADNEKENKEEK